VGTGFAGVRKVQPVPQPQQNPSIYPGVLATHANPYYQPYLDITFFYYLIANMMFLSAPLLCLEAINISFNLPPLFDRSATYFSPKPSQFSISLKIRAAPILKQLYILSKGAATHILKLYFILH
jgi:hypothetical protein